MTTLMDTMSSALEALLAGADQHTRLLRLHTPLGENVLVAERMRARECVFGMEDALDPAGSDDLCGYRIEIDALSTDAHLELKQLIGQPALLELLTQASRSALRPFHGQVTEFSLLGSEGGVARYRLVLEPWLAFLRWRTDSYVFQDLSVIDVIEKIFADYQGQGLLDVQWRVAVADRARYRPISLLTQYRESDLAFVRRIAAQEGLVFWFEHQSTADADGKASAPFGRHTLVIADRNDAFAANAQARVRFARAGAVVAEDALQGWHPRARVAAHSVALTTWDYRTLEQRRAEAAADSPGADLAGTFEDHPGVYAAADSDDAQRYATQQLEALRARDVLVNAIGTVRTLAPATTFTLADHEQVDAGRTWAVLAVDHEATSNLGTAAGGPDTASGLGTFMGTLTHARDGKKNTAKDATPLYRQRAVVLAADTPYRPLRDDEHGLRLHPKPTVYGTQTAIVVGVAGQPVTTDRDHRIKLQFAWARGDASASRLDHPGGKNAPADETAGTWVRVAETLAGANWGGSFVPRSGQEVLVTFLEGDIDRPVIIGAVYNGQGTQNAQTNSIGQAAGGATPNAPAWFPGSQSAHAHNAVLAGIKTQAMTHSQDGTGGHNQLIFDATPDKARVSLATTQAASGLHLGHLRTQADNQLIADRGHGAELTTEAQGALRAGSGLIISADAKGTGQASLHDAQEAIAQIEQAKALALALAQTAKHQGATLPKEAEPDKLPVQQAQAQALEALKATDTRGGASAEAVDDQTAIRAIDGGAGTAPVWLKPHLVLSAPAGTGLFTPASQTWTAGATLQVTALEDASLAAAGELRVALKDGLTWFTHGAKPEAGQNGPRPITETGIKLHAASGKVSVQAQTDKADLNAQKDVSVQSTAASVLASAPKHQLLTAQGAYIRLEGGNIQVHAPGSVTFHAGQKNWTGAQSVDQSVSLAKPATVSDCSTRLAVAKNT